MTIPDLHIPVDLVRAPWSDPDFGYVALVIVALLVVTAAALIVVTRRGRGGAPPRTLWARWGTWAVLAPLFALVCFSGLLPIALLMAAFALQGTREWGTLLGLPRPHRVVLSAYSVLAIGLAMFGAAVLLAIVPLLFLAAMLQPVVGSDTTRGMRDLAFGALGFAYLPFLLAFGVLMRRDLPDGAALLFVTGAAVAFSDIAAYVVGKSMGRHPLAPRLSPNKTREGVLGNLLGALAAIVLFLPIVPDVGPALVILLAVVVGVGAVWGDLFKSALKREVGVKDAGTLLPGFGGLLDRIDSFIVAVPLVYYTVGMASLVGLGRMRG